VNTKKAPSLGKREEEETVVRIRGKPANTIPFSLGGNLVLDYGAYVTIRRNITLL
jgi:hypothetical protein